MLFLGAKVLTAKVSLTEQHRPIVSKLMSLQMLQQHALQHVKSEKLHCMVAGISCKTETNRRKQHQNLTAPHLRMEAARAQHFQIALMLLP